jgi:glutathione S-transferase
MSADPRAADAGDRVLYRCRVPTNFLCPCGAVARDLGRRSLPCRTERVSLKRAERAEIVELTGQQRVPVLVDGEEVVHDSRRIRQYLEHRYGGVAGEGA